ncbi:hypothetical protein [Prevotella sp. HUN102]|uniref:hypothetical protein n=1 Tax=Prevotella sp. HUN102 TaxID=1392486 RepID=UPI0012DC779B|nr:hypothetical protein [Prevotella sp. HUN102]
MMIIALLLFILAAYRLRRINSRGDRKYDVFCISEGCMTVHTGLFSLTYKIEEIEEIRFSKIALRRGFRGFLGIMWLRKKRSLIKSRMFLFDSSWYYRKIVLISSESDIYLTTKGLMAELKQHGIRCSIKE